jgi:hypothetical protein
MQGGQVQAEPYQPQYTEYQPSTQAPAPATSMADQSNQPMNQGAQDLSAQQAGANQAMGQSYAQPGVAASPETPVQTPGWTYGVNPTQNQIQGSVAPGQTDTTKIGWNGAPVSSVQGGNYFNQEAFNAVYNQGASRLDPRMQQEQAKLETQLANMGLTRGSARWNNEMQRQMQARNDAYTSLANQATITGGEQAARMQGMDINAGNFANQAAQQNFQNNLQSQQAQNAAYNQAFEQAMASGQFANAAQAQEFAQNQVQSQIRNQAMGEQARLDEQRAARLQQESQFGRQLTADEQKFLTQMEETRAARAQQGSQFGQSLAEQQAARAQQGSQFGQSLAEQQAQRAQQESQFGRTLAEQQAGREQQNQQWAQEYGLKDRTQQAQMSQFAQQFGLSERQLASQIDQWAAQNNISREQMANQLLMSREQNETSRANAATSAGATMGAAQAQAGATTAAAQMNSALRQREIENAERQQDFNMYWQSQMNPIAYQNALMQGMVPGDPNFAGVQTPNANTSAGAGSGYSSMVNSGIQNQNSGLGSILGSLGGFF